MLDPVKKSLIYDENARYHNYPLEKLMENAGRQIAKTIREKIGNKKKIVFICGPGNNGGDGLVAARYLKKDNYPAVFLVPQQIKSELTRKNWEKFKGEKYYGVKAQDLPQKADLVVECLFGTGISQKLKEPYPSIIEKMNHIQAEKISLDLPAPGFKPDLNLSLMIPKTDKAVTLDISYPKWLKESIGVGEVKALNRAKENSRKGKNGQVFIWAGNEKYHGALLLASKMAAKVVDLVFISSTPENRDLIKKLKPSLPEFISIPEKEIEKYLKRSDSILLGPGLGTGPETATRVKKILRENRNKKIILDADGLRVLDKKLLNPNCLLTPHSQEFEDLFKLKANKENLEKMAKKYRCTILLKGRKDIISNGWEVKINNSGNPGMTKGGSGDVLAGLVTGLAATNDIFLSACAGAFLNGLAGDRITKKASYYYKASDLIEEIPRSIKWCLEY